MKESFELNLRSYATTRETHVHGHHQAVFPLVGAMALETGRGGNRVAPESAAVITAGEHHTFSGLEDNSFLVVDVAGTRQGALAAVWDAASSGPVFRLDEGLCQLTRFALAKPELLRAGSAARESLALLLMQGLATQLGALDPREPASLGRARRFISQNLGAPIGLTEIAAAAGTSITKLNRGFHHWHGISPGRYLTHARLQLAEELLTKTDQPVAQIAAVCGYSEQSALTRAMTRASGLTPARLRREARANNTKSR